MGRDGLVGILATGPTVRGSNPGGVESFRTSPDRPQGPPGLVYNWYGLSTPCVKRPRRGVNHQPPSDAEVEERVELYLVLCAFMPCSRAHFTFT